MGHTHSPHGGIQLPWGCLTSMQYTVGLEVYSWWQAYSQQRRVGVCNWHGVHRQLAVSLMLTTYPHTNHPPLHHLYTISITCLFSPYLPKAF